MRIVTYLSVIVFAVFLLGGSFLFWETVLQQSSPKLTAQLVPVENQVQYILPQTPTATLLFVGDIMLDRGVEAQIKTHQDWRWPFLNIADTLQEADIVFGNLESIISDKGKRVGSIYSFRADPLAMEGLTYAGFDVLSIANNHSLDYGREALEDTLSRLGDAEIAYTGTGFSKSEAHSPAVLYINETEIGFLAYAGLGPSNWAAGENYSGIAWIDENTLSVLVEDILRAKSKTDIIIVSLHAGEEYTKDPSEFQRVFAKTAIDAGADLVIGHHPHVVQSIEQYKGKTIAYSLGNFIFDQDFSADTMQGLMLKVLVQNKKIQEVIPLKTKINSSFQVELSE